VSVVEQKRRKGESFEGFFRRFTRRVQHSGKILEKRKRRYFKRVTSDTKLKDSALRGIEIRDKREYMIRVGSLIEDKRRGRGRGRR